MNNFLQHAISAAISVLICVKFFHFGWDSAAFGAGAAMVVLHFMDRKPKTKEKR